MKPSLLIYNIGMLATACGNSAHGGKAQGEIQIIENAYVAVEGNKIVAVGQGEVPAELRCDGCKTIDANNKLVTAGLVDAHTHLVFGGTRACIKAAWRALSGHSGAGRRHSLHRSQHQKSNRRRTV